MTAIFDRLARAVTLESDDAAIRITAHYEPQGGRGTKVAPPTYLPAADSKHKYHIEPRWDVDGEEADVVLLDSIQSQANRAEAALLTEAEALGLPQILLEVQLEDRTIRISSLSAPHRSRDAYLLDSEIDGVAFDKTEIGQLLNRVTADDATAALRFAPYDLSYGVWDSHRGKRVALRFPRVYTSELVGWHPLVGRRAATKSDPLNLPGKDQVPTKEWRPEMASAQAKKAQTALSELGHGMVPSQPSEEAGGVSVKRIERRAVLSLTGLAALRFPNDGHPTDTEGRVALAAVALLGDRLAFARPGVSLRSGCDLALLDETVEWVQSGGRTEMFELTPDAARELLTEARDRLASVGIAWSGEPIRVSPTPRLQEIIARTFYVADYADQG